MSKFSDEAADYELRYLRDTDAAWCVDAGLAADVWLPKSQCEVNGGDLHAGKTYTFTVPNWLAEQKGLV